MIEYRNPHDVWFTNYNADCQYTKAKISTTVGVVDSIDLTKNDLVVTVTPKVELPTFWQVQSEITGEWKHVYKATTLAAHNTYATNRRYRRVETPKEISK